MNKSFIHARLASGPYMNKPNDDIFIPRIKFMPDDAKCPVEFQRIQFPIRLDFGITANRSQGKTYKVVGKDVFIWVGRRLGRDPKLEVQCVEFLT